MQHVNEEAAEEVKRIAKDDGCLFRINEDGSLKQAFVIDADLSCFNYEEWSFFYSSGEDSFYKIVNGELVKLDNKLKEFVVSYRDGEVSAIVKARTEDEARKKFKEGDCDYTVQGLHMNPNYTVVKRVA